MIDESLLVLGADDVAELLRSQEAAILQAVKRAYETHGRGHSIVPHSSFLRFPGGRDRLIALPAYLGETFGVAGMKWIASFPGNLALGLERASGLVVLNSVATGRPCAVVEGSVVSAKRTAASAALAACLLHGAVPPERIGLLGCGAIGFETLRFLLHVWPTIAEVVVCDLSSERAARFAARCLGTFERIRVHFAGDGRALLGQVPLVSIATTAMHPYLDRVDGGELRTVLHVSLRDLAPAIILAADNVVDDIDHVCRAETSVHLAERMAGHRRFIRCTLPEMLTGAAPCKRSHDQPTIFSPFGLGILDIAVAELVCERATARAKGTRLPFASTVAV